MGAVVPDITTHMIYGLADRPAINSWLRTMNEIRQSPQTWPARWANLEEPEQDAP